MMVVVDNISKNEELHKVMTVHASKSVYINGLGK